jgi:peptidoglycan hydrolase-like protein with peptidoglycan-binding domain
LNGKPLFVMRRFGYELVEESEMKLASVSAVALFLSVPAFAQAPSLSYSQELSPTALQAVQQGLARSGAYAGRVDGRWGPDSATALERYQQAHQLQVTGQMNAATASSLGIDPNSLLGDVPSSAAEPAGPRGEMLQSSSVRALQIRLRELGFYNGPGDGVWGANTQGAIERFQRARGLRPTGSLDTATINTMKLNPNAVVYR